MKPLILGDSYYDVFKPIFLVNEDIVFQCYRNSDRRESLDNNVTLFLKRFNEAHKKYLLLGTQEVQNEIIFGFAYWIPEELVQKDLQLLNILECFANRFGLKLKISNSESRFFYRSKSLIEGKFHDPFQIVKILGPDSIPCTTFLSFKENPEYKINWIELFYTHSINHNKYLLWLNFIPISKIKVPGDWANSLSQILEDLDPYGSTKLEIHHPKSSEKLYTATPSKAKKDVELLIPTSYRKPFEYIISNLRSLKKNEKIAIVPVQRKDDCVFCGSKELSDEHIFPKWMRRFFTEKQFVNTLHVKLPDETLASSLKSGISKNKVSSYGYTYNKVCTECNSGWMSKLEEEVITYLLEDENKLKTRVSQLDFSDEGRISISRWAILKSCLLSLRLWDTYRFPRNTPQELMNNKIPNGLIVEITDTEYFNLDFAINKGLPDLRSVKTLKIDSKIANELALEFSWTSLHIGNYFFRISYLEKNQPMHRYVLIKSTVVLYPPNFELPYLKIENETKRWQEIPDNIKFRVFNMGLSLSE